MQNQCKMIIVKKDIMNIDKRIMKNNKYEKITNIRKNKKHYEK